MGYGSIIGSIALIFLLFFVGSKILRFFGVGNPIHRMATVLSIEDRGVINVSLEGGPMKRAEDQLKLYPGDVIQSNPRTYASLTFFDGTTMRLDENSRVTVIESFQGEESSELTIALEEGSLWVATPTLQNSSGAITRRIETPYLAYTLPSQTEAITAPSSLTVFSADALGITVSIGGTQETVYIGEGQQFILPTDADRTGDLYQYRSPLDPERLHTPFVEESRKRHFTSIAESERKKEESKPLQDVILTILNPREGITVETSTITVNGRIGKDVTRVRVNGYVAEIEEGSFAFSQELTLPNEDAVSIEIEAEDKDGIVIAEAIRTITRNRKPPEPPKITHPASAGQTYRTNSQEIEVRGEAPEGAIGIIVNDYRLQLFSPGDSEWNYLANTAFDNFVWGENIFEITAINSGGYKSEKVTITIVLEEGTEGVIKEAKEAEEEKEAKENTSSQGESSSIVLNNVPILPGTINVTDPQPGADYTASKNAFSILGVTHPSTHTMWVNGYRLRLYEAGSTAWKYIASTEMGTMQRGKNAYEITARDRDGKVLDTFTYTVNFKPGR